MPRDITLHGQMLDVAHIDTPDGERTWVLTMTDRISHDVIRVPMKQPLRDEIVRKLTNGIVLAGGELPKL
jgi:hypothetical protein